MIIKWINIMFKIEEKLLDDTNDDISVMMSQLLSIPTYTKIKKEIHQKLISTLEKKKFITFVGHHERYHLFRIGESCLYKVPNNRRGFLSIFRGKTIRLICVGSGRYTRILMAGLP